MAFQCKLCDEIHVGSDHLNKYCDQCKAEVEHQESENELYEDIEFQACEGCDGHPACEDFGCAIQAGIIVNSNQF